MRDALMVELEESLQLEIFSDPASELIDDREVIDVTPRTKQSRDRRLTKRVDLTPLEPAQAGSRGSVKRGKRRSQLTDREKETRRDAGEYVEAGRQDGFRNSGCRVAHDRETVGLFCPDSPQSGRYAGQKPRLQA